MNGRPWSHDDLVFVHEHYGTLPAGEIAKQLGRTVRSIWQCARLCGLTRARKDYTQEEQRTIASMARQGYCNCCIARSIGRKVASKGEIRRWRRKLGVPQVMSGGAVGTCQTCLERVRAETKRQCQEAGVASLGQVRVLAFRRFAADHGWPEDLRPRAVQILEALFAYGPMTRPQIAAAIGMPWKGSRKSLVSNDPEGSYLAHLQARGLVVRSAGRLVRGTTKGQSIHLYQLTHEAEVIKHEWRAQEATIADPSERKKSSG